MEHKDVFGAWRLDLPIDVGNTTDNYSDGKSRTSKWDVDTEWRNMTVKVMVAQAYNSR
jgi:hypothetical protein